MARLFLRQSERSTARGCDRHSCKPQDLLLNIHFHCSLRVSLEPSFLSAVFGLGKTLDLDAKIRIRDRCVENLNGMHRFRLHPVHGPGPGMDGDLRAGNVLHSAVRAVIAHMWPTCRRYPSSPVNSANGDDAGTVVLGDTETSNTRTNAFSKITLWLIGAACTY